MSGEINIYRFTLTQTRSNPATNRHICRRQRRVQNANNNTDNNTIYNTINSILLYQLQIRQKERIYRWIYSGSM